MINEVELVKLFANKHRLAILRYMLNLRGIDASFEKIREEVVPQIDQPTCSIYMKYFVIMGLIEGEKVGQYRFYRFRPDVAKSLQQFIDSLDYLKETVK